MDETRPHDPAPPERPWQFSLRQLFGLFPVAGMFAFIFRDAGFPGLSMIAGLYLGACLGASAARQPLWTIVGAALGVIVGAAAGILGALLPAM